VLGIHSLLSLGTFYVPSTSKRRIQPFRTPGNRNFRKTFSRIPFGKFQAVLNERSLSFQKNFSAFISKKRPMIRTPENKKILKLFSPLTPFGKIRAVLNERKLKSKEKKP